MSGTIQIQTIIDWFKLAKPNPTNQNVLQQMAYHFEEVAEMCEAAKCTDLVTTLKKLKADLLVTASIPHKSDEFIAELDKLALLDALCDQIVTALGVGYMMGFDMQGALAEVNRSNWSKFEDDKPVIDKDGKIVKGKYYDEPELRGFIK